MELPLLPPMFSGWDHFQSTFEEQFDLGLLPCYDLTALRPSTPGAWAWGILGQVGGSLQAMGLLEPSTYVPPCEGQNLLASYLTEPVDRPPRDPTYQTGDASIHPSLLDEVNFDTVFDPALSGDVSPGSTTTATTDAVSMVAQYEMALEPRPDTMIVDQGKHIVADMPMGVGLKNDTLRRLDMSMRQPTADENPPISPTCRPTPPKIIPGVYDIFGPPEPRNLVPRSDRTPTPPPPRRGNEYATHLQPWGCSKCGTAFMTPQLLRMHKQFHRPQPPMHEYQNPAFQASRPFSEENLRHSSEQNRYYSCRLRCEKGKWTTFKQTMHGFGDGGDDEGEPESA